MTTIAETSLGQSALAKNALAGTDLDWASATRTRGTRLDTLLLSVFVLYLASNVFDGVLRYALVNLGLPTWLLYMRDVAVIAAVPIAAIAGLRRSGIVVLFVALATIVHSAIAWSTMHSSVQFLFGVKLLLTVAFGALLARPFEQSLKTLRIWFVLLLGLAMAGVLANAVIDFPWTGLAYSVGDVDLQASRDWSSDGVGRAAGFSRGSISAGAQIAILTIFMLTTTRATTLFGALAKAALFAVAVVNVYLTDSRGGLGALLVVGLVLLCQRRGHLLVLKTAIFVAVLPVVLLPIFLPGLNVNAAFTGQALQSFLERIEEGWPGSWDLIFRYGDGLLGRGIGGIGSPQRLFAPNYYFPGDNLTIFLFAYFGVFAALYLACPLAWVVRLPARVSPSVLFAAALLLYFLLFGIVMNIIEDQFAACFLGIMLGLLARGAAATTPDGRSAGELPSGGMRDHGTSQP